MTTPELLQRTKAAWPSLRGMDTAQKNAMLLAMADSLLTQKDQILRKNAADLAAAKDHVAPVMLDRLLLDEGRLLGMADGIRAIAAWAR